MQAEALQQTRRELRQLEEEVQEQLVSMEQLTAERDACKSGAHEASDRSKVCHALHKSLQTRGGGEGGCTGSGPGLLLAAARYSCKVRPCHQDSTLTTGIEPCDFKHICCLWTVLVDQSLAKLVHTLCCRLQHNINTLKKTNTEAHARTTRLHFKK